jgi:hypothetical protein
MAELELMALDESGRTFRTPAGTDTYVAKKAVNLEQPLSTDSTIDGRDIAVDGAVLDTAIQPGDSVTALADYEANAELASQADAETGSNNVKTMTPLRVTQAIAVMASGLKNNTSATTAPTATDDEDDGYAVGSFWVDTLADKAYRCVDASVNIAVWVDTTVSASDLAAVALSGDSDDLIEGATNLLLTPGERAAIASLDGWRDLKMGIVGAASGGGAPALAVFGPTGVIKQMAFAVGDSVYVSGHVDHDIKVGSTVFPHIHWSTNGSNVQPVKWQITHMAAAGHNQANFPPDSILSLEEAAQGTAWRHMITEDPTGFVAPEVDSLFLCEIKRVTNGGTENTDTVFALFVDLHYETDKYGSVNRLPPFYS